MHRGCMQALSASHVNTAVAAKIYFITYILHKAWDMFASSLNCIVPIKAISSVGINANRENIEKEASTAEFRKNTGHFV
jgi:hypothetical protein